MEKCVFLSHDCFLMLRLLSSYNVAAIIISSYMLHKFTWLRGIFHDAPIAVWLSSVTARSLLYDATDARLGWAGAAQPALIPTLLEIHWANRRVGLQPGYGLAKHRPWVTQVYLLYNLSLWWSRWNQCFVLFPNRLSASWWVWTWASARQWDLTSSQDPNFQHTWLSKSSPLSTHVIFLTVWGSGTSGARAGPWEPWFRGG